jgi:hypothetical protein
MIKEDLSSQEKFETKTIGKWSVLNAWWLMVRKHLSIRLLNRCLLLTVVVLGVYYFTSINDLAVKGFEMQKLKRQVDVSNEKNKEFENEKLALESFNGISERSKDLKMVAVGSNVDYLVRGGDFVAKK